MYINDALEAMFDGRANTFCIVTSDSDFAYLCRKLRERGAKVWVIGEAKTPAALRNACDTFHQWTGDESSVPASATEKRAGTPAAGKQAPAAAPRPVLPGFVREAVKDLGSAAPDGGVALGRLGQYLKTSHPDFRMADYGFSRLHDMVKSHKALALKLEDGGHYTVRLQSLSGQARH
jgi:hypothetical protein